jgi:MFS family permease
MNSAQRRRVVAAGMIGNTLEWYDFAIYGYFAAQIGRHFFPHEDAVAQLLSTFGVFAVGYLMRPIGGVIVGHIGDTLGNALQNGTSLLGRPPRMPRHQPRGARSGITHCALWITSKNSCRGLTAPNGGIRSASSIGTIVCSSAVVVGQRFERGVP